MVNLALGLFHSKRLACCNGYLQKEFSLLMSIELVSPLSRRILTLLSKVTDSLLKGHFIGFSGLFETDFSCVINASLNGKLAIHAVTWLIFAVQNAESACATNAI